LDICPFAQNFSGNAFGRESEQGRLGRKCGFGRNGLICRRPDALGTHGNVDVLSRRALCFALNLNVLARTISDRLLLRRLLRPLLGP
jgi:hypothetical protein